MYSDALCMCVHMCVYTLNSVLFSHWISGNKADGNRKRKEKQNQSDLPGRKQGFEICRQKHQQGPLTGVSAQVGLVLQVSEQFNLFVK